MVGAAVVRYAVKPTSRILATSMGVIRYSLFFLPIHRHSQDEYYREHGRWVNPQKKELEKQYGRPFDQLDKRVQAWWETSWFWPTWKFNDVVGFLDVGMDAGDSMTAEMLLKRKWLPRSVKSKLIISSAYSATHFDVKENHEFLHYYELGAVRIYTMDNDSYLKALNQVLREAREILGKHKQNFQLWTPPFDFGCFDFVRAHKQVKDR